MRPAHMILVAQDRYKQDRDDTEPCLLERTNRRRLVSMFLREADYWSLMKWLRHDSGAEHLLLTLGEAAAHFRQGDTDWHHCRYVIARYFNRHLHAKGADGRPLMGREWFRASEAWTSLETAKAAE